MYLYLQLAHVNLILPNPNFFDSLSIVNCDINGERTISNVLKDTFTVCALLFRAKIERQHEIENDLVNFGYIG